MSPWEAELLDAFGPEAVATFALEENELPMLSPRGDEAWSAAMRFAQDRNLRVLAIGRGSKLPWIPFASQPDLLVSTRRDTGVVAFEPGDGTLTARAGTTLEELRALVAEHGYALTPDVARADAKTLGGVIGAGESGFDRLRRGPLRHHVLGTRLLRADGCLAKSGGALVKNVTGYDLHRLYTGSRGSLGIVLEASLRLCPAPTTRAHLEAEFSDRGSALRFAHHALALDLPLDAATVRTTEDGFSAELFLGGRDALVSSELARLEPDPSARTTTSAIGAEAEAAYVAARERDCEKAHLYLTATRTDLGPSLDALDLLFAARDITKRERLHPGIASAQIEVFPVEEAPPLVELRAALPAGARLQWRGLLPLAIREEVRQLPSPKPLAAQRLDAQLRSSLDPEGRFAAVATP